MRVLSATNADLNAEVAQGRFRQDLLFRLNTVELHLPPLRDRHEDIPVLAEHFLRQHRERYRRSIVGFTPEAFDALRAHSWPGNVRELDHVVERAVLMSSGHIVTAFDLALQTTPDARLSTRLEEMSLEDAERLLITKALARFEGNANRAEPESPEELMRFLAQTPILPLDGASPIELTHAAFERPTTR